MTANKQEQIELKRVKPISIDDYISIEIPYEQTEQITIGKGKSKTISLSTKTLVFKTFGKVVGIIDNKYEISIGSVRIPHQVEDLVRSKYKGVENHIIVDREFIWPTYNECGANPFKKEVYRVVFSNIDIHSLIFKSCFGKRSHYNEFEIAGYIVFKDKKELEGKTFGGVNLNPSLVDSEGITQYCQRDLVWTLEEKQNLIDSIYNGIEIGRFLFKYNSWEKIERFAIETGHGYNFDCVDGKQRYCTILHFLQNKFPDSLGNYWKDLSENSQDKFLNFSKLSFGEMGESTKDSEVLETFLTLNFTGVQMSKEHIEFVQSIKLNK